jgi:hypothetical protein
MTYLEKLLLLNTTIFEKANELLAAKALQAKLPKESPVLKSTAKKINILFSEYQQALIDSKNMLFYINLHRINMNSLLF